MEAEEPHEASLLLSANRQRHESLDEGGGGDLVLVKHRADLLCPGLGRQDSTEAARRASQYGSRRLSGRTYGSRRLSTGTDRHSHYGSRRLSTGSHPDSHSCSRRLSGGGDGRARHCLLVVVGGGGEGRRWQLCAGGRVCTVLVLSTEDKGQSRR